MMMKRIGIATITHYRSHAAIGNYGNILQNYALQRYIRASYNADVETIYYDSTYPAPTLQCFGRRHRSPTQFALDATRLANRMLCSKQLVAKRAERKRLFQEFITHNINVTAQSYSYDHDLGKLNADYDCFITGSDQVWNPYWEGSHTFFFLSFAEPHKRLSYAPSFGIGSLPDEVTEQYGELLQGIPYLSVREGRGQRMLEDYFGLHAQQVCDPVLLLGSYEWKKVARRPENVPSEFCARYLLGKMAPLTMRHLSSIRRLTGLPIVDIYTWDNPNALFTGPQEFIWMIAHAKCLITDSFHGAAFAIRFGTPIVMVDRNAAYGDVRYDMGSRQESLLELVGEHERDIESVARDRTPFEVHRDAHALDVFVRNSRQYLRNTLATVGLMPTSQESTNKGRDES